MDQGPRRLSYGSVTAQRARSHDRIDLFTMALSVCASVTYEAGGRDKREAGTQRTEPKLRLNLTCQMERLLIHFMDPSGTEANKKGVPKNLEGDWKDLLSQSVQTSLSSDLLIGAKGDSRGK